MIWAGAMFAMILGITLTYSRTGFLSLLLSTLVCFYQFGIKGRRVYLVMLAAVAVVLLAICTPILGFSSETWIRRMETIVSSDMEGAMDRGSKEAREELLRTSLQLMVAHPLVGIGREISPVCQEPGMWLTTHTPNSEQKQDSPHCFCSLRY